MSQSIFIILSSLYIHTNIFIVCSAVKKIARYSLSHIILVSVIIHRLSLFLSSDFHYIFNDYVPHV